MRSLQVRLPLLTLGVLAASLALSAFLVFEVLVLTDGGLDPAARADAYQALRRMVLAAGIGFVITAVILVATLRRALRPLKDLVHTARATQLEELSARVEEPKRNDEVGQLAREFNRMIERLESAVASQRAFMASVSHELRTPITIALGHLDVAPATDDEATGETITMVREELVRMQRLVQDLMALGRSEGDDFIIPNQMRLEAFIDELELRVTALGDPRVRFLPVDDVPVVADADRVAQAVLNLIVNAIMHATGATKIEVGAEASAALLKIWVGDNGEGIDQSLSERVFEPFVKGESRGGVRTTGLGLAVVDVIARAHGGWLDLQTGVDGTTVWIYLPQRSGAGTPRTPEVHTASR